MPPMRIATLALLLFACSPLPDASPRPGGGTAGAFGAHLTVLVVDRVSLPVEGAVVRVDGTSIGETNAQGRVDADLASYDAVEVEADGYRTERWLGANAAVLTIPLAPVTPVEIPTARVRATIEGWETLPRGAGSEIWAIVGRASDKALDAPENGVHRSSDRLVCVAPRDVLCELEVTVPAGDTRLFAQVVEIDSAAGTATPVAFALGEPIAVDVDELREGVSLALLPASALAPIDLALETPTDPRLDAVVGVPGLGLDRGVLVPLDGLGLTRFLFPSPEGGLGSASIWAIARATGADASSRVVQRAAPGVPVDRFAFTADAFLAPPTLEPSRVTRPGGASGVLEATFGTRLHVLVFDERTSFEATSAPAGEVTAIATEVAAGADGWSLEAIERDWTRRSSASASF